MVGPSSLLPYTSSQPRRNGTECVRREKGECVYILLQDNKLHGTGLHRRRRNGSVRALHCGWSVRLPSFPTRPANRDGTERSVCVERVCVYIFCCTTTNYMEQDCIVVDVTGPSARCTVGGRSVPPYVFPPSLHVQPTVTGRTVCTSRERRVCIYFVARQHNAWNRIASA